MNVRISAIEAYQRALERADDRSAADVARLLTADVVALTNFGRADGAEAPSTTLTGSRLTALASGARWSQPEMDGDRIVVIGHQPVGAPISGLEFAFSFAGDKISRVEQTDDRRGPPEADRPLPDRRHQEGGERGARQPDAHTHRLLRRRRAHPSVVPGTLQTYGDEQLALWARDPEAGLPRNITAHPQVTLFYHDPGSRTSYMFQGRGRIESDAAPRDRIFENSNPREQYMDHRRRGAAIVVDLDRVEGRGPAGRVLTAREAAR